MERDRLRLLGERTFFAARVRVSRESSSLVDLDVQLSRDRVGLISDSCDHGRFVGIDESVVECEGVSNINLRGNVKLDM